MIKSFYAFQILHKCSIMVCFFVLLFGTILGVQAQGNQNVISGKATSISIDTLVAQLNKEISAMNGKTDLAVQNKIRSAYILFKNENKPEALAKYYQLLAKWHHTSVGSENIDSVYHYDRQGLQQFLKSSNKEQISLAYRRVGIDLMNKQQYAQAEIEVFNGLKAAQSIGFQSGINSAHSTLSILYGNTKDYSSALKYSKMVVEEYEKEANYHPLIRALANQSDLYLKTKKPETALRTINKAMDLIKKLPEEYQVSETINIRAWRGMAYRDLKRYNEALDDFMYSWQGIQKKYGPDMGNGWKGNIGSIYYLQGQYAKAIPYLKDFINHMKGKKVEAVEDLKEHYEYLAACLKATGQGDAAYEYMSQAKDLTINALQQETRALKNELRIKYETEQKDNTIASQKGVIQEQKKTQVLSYGIGALLSLLLAGTYFSYRNNKKKNTQLQSLIHELGETNKQLDRRNAENELLLKEIHHRVKNNLEVVSSLLALQSAKMDNPDMQAAMLASQNRVQSMGILHQKLYQSEHLAFIEMKNYFQNLAENILDSYNESSRIKVAIDMPEMELDVDSAVPVGLIVNELLTNSLKYAFPNGQKGEIKLSLAQKDKNNYCLTIADNGIGKNSEAKAQGTGFGSQLVSLLTRQIEGQLVEQNEQGTIVRIDFKRQAA